MVKIVADIVLVSIFVACIIVFMSWKLFFNIGKKADKLANDIKKEANRED